MLKKLFMSGLMILAFSTAQAGDFAPFGLKIGSTATFEQAKTSKANDFIKITPPRPVPKFFDTYIVQLNVTKQIQRVEASGSLDNSKYSCSDIAEILRDQFIKSYPNATSGSQYGAYYSFEVKNGKDFYAAYISCPENKIKFVMYNPFLETNIKDDPELKDLDLNL